jgi:hypothetical protein
VKAWTNAAILGSQIPNPEPGPVVHDAQLWEAKTDEPLDLYEAMEKLADDPDQDELDATLALLKKGGFWFQRRASRTQASFITWYGGQKARRIHS